jgi:hypothetical protein
VRTAVGREAPRAGRGSQASTFFSLGGLLAPFLPPGRLLLSWLLAAFTLAALGCWYVVMPQGRVDAILLGLAAYELLILLTRGPAEHLLGEPASAPPVNSRVRRRQLALVMSALLASCRNRGCLPRANDDEPVVIAVAHVPSVSHERPSYRR